ncbi:MAG: endo-1,4-beta-xylanase [Pyrinomonadaceae bacterium]|nr:endo-1,4-beta-xylanase [Pyrinomonadaceae bacterium]
MRATGQTRHKPRQRRAYAGCLVILLVVAVGYRTATSEAVIPFDITSTFETNTAEGWLPRIGPETVAPTSADKHSGNFSLLTTGRQQPFFGCKINVTNQMATGSRYQISVWAKLAPGSAATNLRINLQRTLGGNTTYHGVTGNVAVTDGAWVLLSSTYNYALAHDTLWLYVESDAGTPSFYIDDFELRFLPPLQIQQEIPALRQFLAPMKIGAAIGAGAIGGDAHTQLLTKHFNSITSENDMKWGPIHPSENTYNYGPADAQVAFAVANGMQVRGHALVWHEQNPNWLFLDGNGQPMTPTPQNKALLLARLDAHIRAVVGHFGSNVYAWDVVNEVIDPAQPDGYRRSQWFNICGTEYIDKAFQVAREVAPNAKLFINDYNTTDPTKRAFLLALVQNLKGRGIPIDGVGHQMHSNIDGPPASVVTNTINMFAAIPGIDNHVTELDISVYNNGTQTYSSIPREVLRRQGFLYRDYFVAFRQANAQGKLSSVTTWGLADDSTWLSNFPIPRLEAPLLFDHLLQAKFAYWGIVGPSRLLVPFDYDNDGKTDFSVFRPSSGAWYLQRSTAGFQGLQFGASGDKLTPADYDGDGKTDIAIYRPSTGIWYILNSSNGTVSYPVFGVAEDLPAPGDYDGDGKADWTVFRPSQGTWYRTNSSNGTTFGMQFGANGDVPTVGDFDGDGKNDLGIFRPSVGDWYNIRSSNGSVFGERFGQTGDRIAPADYDGDGKTDIAIYRPSTGLWVVRKSATATYSYEVFGLPADVPISGDYDGDGKADIGVWRPSDGTWYIKRSDNSQFIVFPWGQTGDKPTPAAYGN